MLNKTASGVMKRSPKAIASRPPWIGRVANRMLRWYNMQDSASFTYALVVGFECELRDWSELASPGEQPFNEYLSVATTD